MNILIVVGHPGKNTFNHALADAFIEGVQKTSATVKTLDISDMNLGLEMVGFEKGKPIENNIREAQDLVSWADHLVWFYPTWWATMPAGRRSPGTR